MCINVLSCYRFYATKINAIIILKKNKLKQLQYKTKNTLNTGYKKTSDH